MSEVSLIVDVESLHRLAELPGLRLKYFGGKSLDPGMFAAFDVFVKADSRAVTVVSEVEYFDFEGEEDTYAYLSVVPDELYAQEAGQAGNIYYFHAGETIDDVLIVRDSISKVVDGNRDWTYVSDTGILFQLSSHAVLSIAKSSQYAETLEVAIANSINDLKLPDLSSIWENKLGIEYSICRALIPINRLLGG